jgi:hypothetical protein
MRILVNTLIATNDGIIQDDPSHALTRVETRIETRTEEWYVTRRITALFPYADQRGMLIGREPKRKPGGKSTRVAIDDALDKKFRALLGL